MPRTARKAPGGVIFHVLNRGVGRRDLFEKEEDFAAFERVLAHALEQTPIDLFSYCLMSNHWHLLLRPRRDGDLGKFMHRLTMTHTRRWQEHYHRVGWGHLYQGRFKSFPVQEDRHFLVVARYVERNPVRANAVRKAQNWPWSSMGREFGKQREDRVQLPLARWPVSRPRDWVEWVNEPQTVKELEALRVSITRGRPFGQEKWCQAMTRRLGLESSCRKPGRPKKKP